MAGVIVFGLRDDRVAWARLYIEPVEEQGRASRRPMRDMTARSADVPRHRRHGQCRRRGGARTGDSGAAGAGPHALGRRAGLCRGRRGRRRRPEPPRRASPQRSPASAACSCSPATRTWRDRRRGAHGGSRAGRAAVGQLGRQRRHEQRGLGLHAALGGRGAAVGRALHDPAAVRVHVQRAALARPAAGGRRGREPFADVAVAVVDPADIGAVAASALLDPATRAHVRPERPQSLRPADRVAILGAALGRDLRLRRCPTRTPGRR